MKKLQGAILVLFTSIALGLILPIWPASQQHINLGSQANDGTGDGLRTAMTKVQNNFNELFRPSRFATNASYTISTNFMLHAWTATTIRGTNTLPAASIGSTTNVVRFIIKDEGGNAASTNIVYQLQASDRIEGPTTTDFALGVNFQTIRIYTAGGTNWFYW